MAVSMSLWIVTLENNQPIITNSSDIMIEHLIIMN